MTDDRDSYRVEPDAEFADRLERVLLRRLAAPAGSSTDASAGQDVTAFYVDQSGDGIDAVGRTRIDMALVATERVPTRPDGRHRWPILAVVAAAVVAIVVGGLILADRDDSAPPVPADTVAPDATTADEEVARGFLDAYVANDADQALTFITDGAIAAAGMWGSVEEFRGDIAWNAATETKLMINNCEPRGYEFVAGVTLRCGFDFHMLGSDALGNDPFGDNYWDLTIRDGQIVAAAKVTPASNGWTALWSSFQLWIKAEHPDDLAVLYDGQYFGSTRLTEDALELWEQRTPEYVLTLPNNEDIEAYAADVAAICATRAPELGEVAVPTDRALDQVATEYTAAAAVLEQTMKDLVVLDGSTDMQDYRWFSHQLRALVAMARESAAAATAGDSTRLAELNAASHELRQSMASGPNGFGPNGSGLESGLEECLKGLQS